MYRHFCHAIIAWIRSYLHDRRLAVKIKDVVSDEIEVPSGVPQGSHFGPLFFILFMSDVDRCFPNVQFALFADDLKMFRSVESDSDRRALQQALDNFSEWCKVNELTINATKCNVIHFHRGSTAINYVYKLDNLTLIEVKNCQDLGVIFDNKLSFAPHIEHIRNKALAMLGFIYRHCNDFSIESLKILYCALIRPYLEYNSVIWNPHYKIHIHSLESVQHKFLRIINFRMGSTVETISYKKINSSLGLTTLENRRIINDLVFFQNIVCSFLDCNDLVNSVNYRVPTYNTRATNNFFYPHSSTNYFRNSPLIRLHRTANECLTDIDIFNCIKSQIKSLEVHIEPL